MKKKIVSFFIIVAVLLVSYLYSYKDFTTCIYDEATDPSAYIATGTLVGEEQLVQTFSLSEKTFQSFSLKADLIGNVENVVLKYKILDEDQALLREGSVKVSELNDQEWNTVSFSEIENANEKKFTLVLAEENADLQNGISFSLTPLRQEGTELTVKGNATDATLVASFNSNFFDFETFVVLLGMLSFIAAFMKLLFKMFK